MIETLVAGPVAEAVPLTVVAHADVAAWREAQPPEVRSWLKATAFTGEVGGTALIPKGDGTLARVVLVLGADRDPWAFAGLPERLPAATYRLEGASDARLAELACLGWALGSYAFGRYKKREKTLARLEWPAEADRMAVENVAAATFLVRDLINTPANDMGPEELAEAARSVAETFGATVRTVIGGDLLTENYPAIHAVGKASARAPRLIDLRWGDEAAPKVTLVGKGVCFDSGGLDLKSAGNMKLMKKDMGGAALVLGLARMIMAAGLKVRLRVLIPAVENSVSGDAMRPLDVIRTRKGLTVEIGNTDAEGRVILCDALAEAEAEKPALLIDCATLTGAARVALGVDLPALFTHDDQLAADILRHGEVEADPLWRLPLWKGYRKFLDSKVADLNNASDSPYAGAITAALFLAEFVSPETPWAHIDLMAWNTSARPGRPEGGEAMAMRALFGLIAERFDR